MKTDANNILRENGSDALRAAFDCATDPFAEKPPCVHVSDWVKSFTPPDYVVEGVLQRGFFYSMTGRTGSGKTSIAIRLSAAVGHPNTGQHFGPYEVEPGRVLYIPAENHVDVQMRFIGLSHRLRIDLSRFNLMIDYDAEKLAKNFDVEFTRIQKQFENQNNLSLVIIDTSPAMFQGDEENSNAQIGNHARRLRKFTTLPGKPSVIALCHPTKNASDPDHLIPRGGGAYLAEVDGNLSVWDHGDRLADLHWCGKFRGPSFEKFTFKHETINTMQLMDTKGRLIPTVVSRLVSEEEIQEAEHTAVSQEDQLLTAILEDPKGTLETWATACGWKNKYVAMRVAEQLKKLRLIRKRGRDIVLTKDGRSAATKARKIDGEACE
ncbi:MAG: AAA family ATPase [Xanthobacteraceae bacterium]